ncbi:MAG: hypothetical protein M0Q44_01385 [Methylobacter sp.]|jgi:predicted RNase H-like nuclease (RuvC/YqgF family)|nr:hypothetical protein [Methylobacter sp.]
MISQEELVGGGIGSVIGFPLLVWFYKRVFAKAAFEDTSKTATDAQCSVIEMLRSEVERMAHSNKELGLAVAQFQHENVALKQEMSKLHETINQLSLQVAANNLMREQCGECEHNQKPVAKTVDLGNLHRHLSDKKG